MRASSLVIGSMLDPAARVVAYFSMFLSSVYPLKV
jgi:hypothetical protein